MGLKSLQSCFLLILNTLPQKQTLNYFSFKEHSRVVHHGMKYICEICTKQYAKKDNLREHKRRIHGKFEDGAKFECDICHQLFINQSLVKYHRNMKHGIDYEGDAKTRIYATNDFFFREGVILRVTEAVEGKKNGWC